MIESFATYEKTANFPTTSLQDTRLGRWILLYGILECLSSISVQVSGLKYNDKVTYFINSSLDGIPPWRSSADQPEVLRRLGIEEPSQHRSHCWLRAVAWEREKLEVMQKRSPPTFSASSLSPPPTLESQNSSARSTPPPQQRAAIQQRQFQVQNFQSQPSNQSYQSSNPMSSAQAVGGPTLAALKSELANLSDGRFQTVGPELEPYNIHPSTLPPVNAAPRRANISLYPNTSSQQHPSTSNTQAASLGVNPNGVRTDIISSDSIPLRFRNTPDVPTRNPGRPLRLTPGQSPILGYDPQTGGEVTPDYKDMAYEQDGVGGYFDVLDKNDV